MIAVLQVVIGIVFILLLFSLLGTTVMELISGALALRGKHLFKALQNMLGDQFDDFVSHPFYRQLMEDAQTKRVITHRALPSYMSSSSFRSVFLDTIKKGSDDITHLKHHIDELKDGELKSLLQFLMRDAKGDPDRFNQNIDIWFNQVMDRVSGWYKRTTRYWLIGIGMGIAILFNADTVHIYKALSSDAALRADVNARAQVYVHENGTLKPINTAETRAYTQEQLSALKSPLGLGWSAEDFQASPYAWLERIVGWITTALAVSLGAPFWFDALRKLVNVNVGSSSRSKKEEEGDG